MLNAFWRLLQSVGYLLTGRTDKMREVLDRDPMVIKAKFERIVGKKGVRINQFMEAMATLVAQQEKKKLERERLSTEIDKNEKLKQGAAALLRKRLEEMKAANPQLTKEEAQQDARYRELTAKFNDVSSTQTEQKNSLVRVEEDIVIGNKREAELTLQLKALKAEIEKIKAEKAETIADVITSTQERDLNKMLAGLSMDDTASRDLQEMREMRGQLRGEAKVSRIAAGTENATVEAELMAMANQTVSSKELEQMVDLDAFFGETKEVKGGQKDSQRESLPE